MLTPTAPDSLRLFALGGLGEIGLNCLALEVDGRILLVDCGLMFPEPHYPGIDLILPDVQVLEGRQQDIVGLVLTHGHEDHIGALPYLWQRLGRPPLYGTRLTLALAELKLEEHGLDHRERLHRLSDTGSVTLGPFTVEPFAVTHSIGDSVGLGIRTPLGLVVHTGDIKLDPTPIDGRATDLARLDAYGDEGVKLLLSDSTNSEHEGRSLSEAEVGAALREIVPRCDGRVIVATFASNVHRLQQVVDAALAGGRTLAVHGRSMETMVGVARRLGILRLPDSRLLPLKQALALPCRKQLILTTGSQGEAQSGLIRMALGEHPLLNPGPGDTVILSSKFIPGNEKAIANLINLLCRRGAEVVYEKVSEIHVSGHACREEQREILQRLRPQHFLPVHGEARHLALHARLAQEEGLPPERVHLLGNGQPLLLTPQGAEVGERLPTGRLLLDGKSLGNVDSLGLRERRQLAHHGVVVAAVPLTAAGALAGPIDLQLRGLPQDADGTLAAGAAEALAAALAAALPAERASDDSLYALISRSLRRHFNRTLARRPLVIPVLQRL